jgi:hypothetical protein
MGAMPVETSPSSFGPSSNFFSSSFGPSSAACSSSFRPSAVAISIPPVLIPWDLDQISLGEEELDLHQPGPQSEAFRNCTAHTSHTGFSSSSPFRIGLALTIDKFLRENFVAAKNHLSIQPNVGIPVAQHLRMTLDVDSRIALDDVWRVCIKSNKTKGNLIPSLFLDEVAQKMNQVGPSASDDERNKKEQSVRLEVYNDICKNRVDGRSLLRYVQTALDGP